MWERLMPLKSAALAEFKAVSKIYLDSLESEFSPVLQFQVLVQLRTNANKLANYMLASTGLASADWRTCFMNMVEFMIAKEWKSSIYVV